MGRGEPATGHYSPPLKSRALHLSRAARRHSGRISTNAAAAEPLVSSPTAAPNYQLLSHSGAINKVQLTCVCAAPVLWNMLPPMLYALHTYFTELYKLLSYIVIKYYFWSKIVWPYLRINK